MALTATIYTFDVHLADADRDVYETLSLRLARHPSESEEFFVCRLLAYLLEYRTGIEMSRGVSTPEEPAIFVRDATGRLTAWIDIGVPDAARLHKASKAAPRVAVYTHKDPAQWLRGLAGANIFRGDALELYAVDRVLIDGLVERLERRMALSVSIAERDLFISLGNETLVGAVARLRV